MEKYRPDNRTGKTVLILAGLLMFIPLQAEETAMAMDSKTVAKNDFSQAGWVSIPGKVDVVEDYNLALGLLKTQGRSSREQALMRSAAREGLVTAYRRLQPASIKPVTYRAQPGLLTPEDWVRLQPGKNYTLQVASSRNRTSIEKWYEQNHMEGRGGYYRNRRQGSDWYTLIYGSYTTASEARNAIEALPAQLRKWKPWVRNMKDVQRVLLPMNQQVTQNR